MDAIQALLSRRSIRKYKPDAVPNTILETLLRVAMSAPSAKNQQPWEFLVINDKKILQEIPKFHPYAAMTAQAPLAILVCGNMQREQAQGFWVQDCSAAVENLLVAVQSYNLGAVWVGVYPHEARMEPIRTLFQLPSNIIPFALIPIGYPDEIKPQAERFDKTRIHTNKW